MEIIYILMALLSGAVAPVQAGINAQLNQHWAGNVIVAAIASFATGTIILILFALVTKVPFPGLDISDTKAWHWLGGAMGAYFITVMVFLAPKLGAITMMVLVIAGQLCVSLILDHFGFFGYAQKSISFMRVAGVLMVAAGIFLVRRF